MSVSPLEHYPITMMSIQFLLDHRDPRNPRSISDSAMGRLVGVISEHGFLEPVQFNAKLDLLVGGHQRIEAASSLGYLELPVVVVEFDDPQHRAANISLNARFGIYEDDLLRKEVLDLHNIHYDLDMTALEPWIIEGLLTPKDLEPEKPNLEKDKGFPHTCPACGHTFTE